MRELEERLAASEEEAKARDASRLEGQLLFGVGSPRAVAWSYAIRTVIAMIPAFAGSGSPMTLTLVLVVTLLDAVMLLCWLPATAIEENTMRASLAFGQVFCLLTGVVLKVSDGQIVGDMPNTVSALWVLALFLRALFFGFNLLF